MTFSSNIITIAEMQKKYFLYVYRACNLDINEVAKILGVSERTVFNYRKKYYIDLPSNEIREKASGTEDVIMPTNAHRLRNANNVLNGRERSEDYYSK